MTDRNETSRYLPMPATGAPYAGVPRGTAPQPSAFAAQAMGQGGVRRGLRGGAPVLAAARCAYLSAQWSGADDRRPPTGLIRRAQA